MYKILGFDSSEGEKVDLYQNVGRFLYRYAGSVLEDTTKAVFEEIKGGKGITITNSISSNPKTFSIDSYVKMDNKAHEIKWRDATTDGDHIKKESNKIKAIRKHGMIPVRIMFYMPNRLQAKNIQERIINEYRANGEAYVGNEAWEYIEQYTNFDLRKALFG